MTFLTESTINPTTDDTWLTTEGALTDTDEESELHWLIKVNRVVYLFTCIAGSIGNLLVIYTIWRVTRLHTVMYFMLASLGVADLILCLFYLPFIIVELFNGERWLWGRGGCKLVFYIQQVSVTVSILNLTAVSIERFVAVRFPLQSRQYLTMGNAKIVTIVIWLAGFIYSTPLLFVMDTWGHERDGVPVENCYLILPKGFPSIDYQMWFLFYLLIPLFIIPLIVMTVCYSIIIYTIYSRQMFGQHGGGGAVTTTTRSEGAGLAMKGMNKEDGKCNEISDKAKRESNVKKRELQMLTAMLIIVIVLFMACWSPNFFFNVIESYGGVPTNLTNEKIRNFLSVLAILNSAMNPIIYAFLSPTFRASAVWALTSLFRRGKAHPNQLSYATTVTGTKTNTQVAYK